MTTVNKNSEVSLRSAISMIPKSDADQLVAHSGAREERDGGDTQDIRLDDAARDRLIFYGRQDGAHALLNTLTLLKRVNRINTMLRTLFGLVIVLIAAVVYLAVKR